MNKWFSVSAIVLSAFLLAFLPACGGSMGSSGTTTTTTEPQPVEVTVNILGNRFDPAELTVPAGSTVTFHNTTSTDHGFSCDAFDAVLAAGQDYPFTFDAPGTYDVRTTTHDAGLGLRVTIVVE